MAMPKVRSPIVNTRRPRSGTYQRSSPGSIWVFACSPIRRPSASNDDGHDRPARRRRPFRADDRRDPGVTGGGRDRRQRLVERGPGHVRHGPSLVAMAGQAGLGQAHDRRAEPAGCLDRRDRGRHGLVERGRERGRGDRDPDDRHRPSLPAAGAGRVGGGPVAVARGAWGAVRWPRPAELRQRGTRERRAPASAARDREPPRGVAALPAGPGLRRPGQRDGRPVRRGRGRLRGVLGEARARADRLVDAVRDDARMGPAVREVVHRRRAQRRLQLRRPARRARPRRQGRLPLDRRAGRHPDADLPRPPARGQQGGQRAQGARRRDGRPGRHLHADDPGAADRDARLRPDRGAAHGRLRRLLGRGAVGPDQRLRGEGPDHRRRRLPARQGGRAQGPRRRGARRHADDRGRRSSSSGSATTSTMVAGRDHWWHDLVDRQSEDCPPVAGRVRAHALPALHVGHDRQAEGHPPHDRRLPRSGRRSATRRSSTSSPTTCTGAPPTSAG